MNEELLLVDEQRQWLLEMGSTPGEDNTVKIVDITMGGFRILHKLNWDFRGISSNFESSPVVKMLSNNIVPTEKSVAKENVSRHGKLYCCLIFRNCHGHPSLEQTTILISQGAAINTEAKILCQQNGHKPSAEGSYGA